MTTPTRYFRPRGETITIAIADSGAVSGQESTVSAKLRAFLPGRTTLLATAPIAAIAVVTFRAADTVFPVGWALTVDAATCLSLPMGSYQIDLKIALGGGQFTVTTPAVIIITEPATL